MLGYVLTGCPGDFDGQLHDTGAETAGHDSIKLDKQISVQVIDQGNREAGAPAVEAGSCASEDELTPCDPVTSEECAEGAACYIVRGEYLDCICPPGSVPTGGGCNTATDCVPGHTCYSSTGGPPGNCLALCDCSTTTSCQLLAAFSPFGLCGDPP